MKNPVVALCMFLLQYSVEGWNGVRVVLFNTLLPLICAEFVRQLNHIGILGYKQYVNSVGRDRIADSQDEVTDQYQPDL